MDVDSLPVEVHGHQPGSEYNGHYHARIYHPLVASLAETGDLIDARLRESAVHTAQGALRMAEPRTFYFETTYKAESWSRPRRAVLILEERPGELFLPVCLRRFLRLGRARARGSLALRCGRLGRDRVLEQRHDLVSPRRGAAGAQTSRVWGGRFLGYKYTVGDLAGCYDSEGRYGGTDLCAQKICKGYWPGDLAEPFHQGGLPAWISVDRGSTWKVARDPVEGIPYMLRALEERLVIFSSHILKLYGVQPATCTVPSEFTPFHFSLETTDGASWTTRCPHRGGSGFAGVPNCIEREWALPGRFLDVYELGRVRITSNWNGCANALIGARNDPTRDPDYVPINSSSALPPYLPRHHGDQVAVGAGGLVGLFRPCNDETTAPGRIQFYGYPVGSEMPPDSWPHEPWQIQDPIEYPGTSVTFGRAEIAPANTPAGDGYQPLVP